MLELVKMPQTPKVPLHPETIPFPSNAGLGLDSGES